jgi:hypothetical protein
MHVVAARTEREHVPSHGDPTKRRSGHIRCNDAPAAIRLWRWLNRRQRCSKLKHSNQDRTWQRAGISASAFSSPGPVNRDVSRRSVVDQSGSLVECLGHQLALNALVGGRLLNTMVHITNTPLKNKTARGTGEKCDRGDCTERQDTYVKAINVPRRKRVDKTQGNHSEEQPKHIETDCAARMQRDVAHATDRTIDPLRRVPFEMYFLQITHSTIGQVDSKIGSTYEEDTSRIDLGPVT